MAIQRSEGSSFSRSYESLQRSGKTARVKIGKKWVNLTGKWRLVFGGSGAPPIRPQEVFQFVGVEAPPAGSEGSGRHVQYEFVGAEGHAADFGSDDNTIRRETEFVGVEGRRSAIVRHQPQSVPQFIGVTAGETEFQLKRFEDLEFIGVRGRPAEFVRLTPEISGPTAIAMISGDRQFYAYTASSGVPPRSFYLADIDIDNAQLRVPSFVSIDALTGIMDIDITTFGTSPGDTWSWQVGVRDAADQTAELTVTLLIRAEPPPPTPDLVLTGTSSLTVQVNTALAGTGFVVTGAQNGGSWGLEDAPSGLTISPDSGDASRATLAWTPTATGVFIFFVTYTDNHSTPRTARLRVTVQVTSEPVTPDPFVATVQGAALNPGQSRTRTFSYEDETAPVTNRILNGAEFPAGLSATISGDDVTYVASTAVPRGTSQEVRFQSTDATGQDSFPTATMSVPFLPLRGAVSPLQGVAGANASGGHIRSSGGRSDAHTYSLSDTPWPTSRRTPSPRPPASAPCAWTPTACKPFRTACSPASLRSACCASTTTQAPRSCSAWIWSGRTPNRGRCRRQPCAQRCPWAPRSRRRSTSRRRAARSPMPPQSRGRPYRPALRPAPHSPWTRRTASPESPSLCRNSRPANA